MKKKIIANGYKPVGEGKHYEKWIHPAKRFHLIDEGTFVKIHIDTYKRYNKWQNWIGGTRIFKKKHKMIYKDPLITAELEKFNH